MHVFQDHDTANAIGSKSYNTLMGELVALESQNPEPVPKRSPEDDSVDFVAATTAALGVPSPSLSRGLSFEGSPGSVADQEKPRKGDVEEEVELLRVLKLSESEVPPSPTDDSFINMTDSTVSSAYLKCSEPACVVGKLEGNCFDGQTSGLKEESTSDNCETLINHSTVPKGSETIFQEANVLSSKMELGGLSVQLTCEESTNLAMCENADKIATDDVVHDKSCTDDLVLDKNSTDDLVHAGGTPPESSEHLLPAAESNTRVSGGEHDQDQSTSSSDMQKQDGYEALNSSSPLTPTADSDSSKERKPNLEKPEGITSLDGEPIYEGEENILESEATVNQNREPMYEGEVILAEQGDKGYTEASNTKKDEISPKEGEEICCTIYRSFFSLYPSLSYSIFFSSA